MTNNSDTKSTPGKNARSTKRNRSRKPRGSAAKGSLRVIPLGGMGEIGKNLCVLEYGEDMIIIDCGLKFPEEEMLGIDFVIPDIQYLLDNKERIRGLFLTHGHEDHIGALPFILHKLNVPIYGTPLTLGLVANKMAEASTGYRPRYNEVHAGDKIQSGCFSVSFVTVCHSIPQSLGLAIQTPLGMVVHTGDFKMDMTPIDGQQTDFAAFAELGSRGVLLLMSDSTNVEKDGFVPSERTVGQTFDQIFRQYKDRRIVIATFASNLHRAQQVFNTAARFNRKVVLQGRSMLANIELARKLQIVNAPDDLFLLSKEAEGLSPSRLVVLTTGSQGEPFSGLVMMSKGEHKQIRLSSKDLVVVSATPIPGNEKLVSHTVNRLFACGCEVIYERNRQIHVSGHACREELKLMLSLVKPRFFVPAHGEYRHLIRHAQLAREQGVDDKNVFVLQNGEMLAFAPNGKSARVEGKVASGAVLIDGIALGEFEGRLLKERHQLSEDGMICVSVVIDEDLQLLAPIEIQSRGSIFSDDDEHFLEEAEGAVLKALVEFRKGRDKNPQTLPTEIRKRMRETLSRISRNYPTLVPLVTVVPRT